MIYVPSWFLPAPGGGGGGGGGGGYQTIPDDLTQSPPGDDPGTWTQTTNGSGTFQFNEDASGYLHAVTEDAVDTDIGNTNPGSAQSILVSYTGGDVCTIETLGVFATGSSEGQCGLLLDGSTGQIFYGLYNFNAGDMPIFCQILKTGLSDIPGTLQSPTAAHPVTGGFVRLKAVYTQTTNASEFYVSFTDGTSYIKMGATETLDIGTVNNVGFLIETDTELSSRSISAMTVFGWNQ